LTELLALAGVALAGLFLLCLGIAGFLAPEQARRFLSGFATTPALHYLELAIRMLIGAAFILHAPATRVPEIFVGAGWILLVTTAVLALIPWRWHREFASRSVPQALRHLTWLAGASCVLGIAVLYLAFAGAGQV